MTTQPHSLSTHFDRQHGSLFGAAKADQRVSEGVKPAHNDTANPRSANQCGLSTRLQAEHVTFIFA